MSASTIFVFMVVMEICLVNIVLGDVELPKKTEKVYPAQSPPISTTLDSADENFDLDASQKRLQQALLIDRVCRVLFPSLFLFLNCVYWFWALVCTQSSMC